MDIVTDEINRLINTLKEQTYDELSRLPPRTDKDLGKRETIAIWKDNITDSQIRIVVQGYEKKLLGMGLISAQGFHKTKDGQCLPLTENELWEFL